MANIRDWDTESSFRQLLMRQEDTFKGQAFDSG